MPAIFVPVGLAALFAALQALLAAQRRRHRQIESRALRAATLRGDRIVVIERGPGVGVDVIAECGAFRSLATPEDLRDL